jgi:hypothetical protein
MADVSKMSQTLYRKLLKSDNHQALNVIVQLKSLDQKRGTASLSNSKEEMRSFLRRLEALKSGGERITCKPYEALSSASVRAHPDVLLKLTDFDEVLEIIDEQAVTFMQPVQRRTHSFRESSYRLT